MGYMVELNTLLGLPADFDTTTLKEGETYEIVRPRERAFPLGIAILMVTSEWLILGYAVARSATVGNKETKLVFEVISLFPPEQQELYRQNFLKAAKVTGEVK